MGITGLIPFLEKASKRGNISQFAGGTVAIDSYCWLHKGAFSCADKIALGQPTEAHVTYCMKFVHMLLAKRIKPILVFDGRHLPAKKETETRRRENRESTRRRAAELIKMGQTSEGRNLLRRSVDITHEMALQLIKRCQAENVDCIVAPYEADSQLAYLNLIGIADVVITEDSDLTLFGCTKIFFKMDMNGNGLLVQRDRLHLAMKLRPEQFHLDKFCHMCILSGCDYLASLPGIGLGKACKFIVNNTDDDIYRALTRLSSFLNMKGLTVTKEYRDAFLCALVTFKHQLVYCPLQRKQVRLTPPSPEVTKEQLYYAGEEVSEDVAYQLALGNYDPFSMKKLHNFNPDEAKKHSGKTNSWHEKPAAGYVSIWSKDYKVNEQKKSKTESQITKWPNTAGKILVLNTDSTVRKVTPKKRNFEELAEELSADDALELYGSSKMQKNDDILCGQSTPPQLSDCVDPEYITSPILSRRANPFVKSTNDSQISPSLVCRGKRRIKLKNLVGFRSTVIDENIVENSKYFSSDSTTTAFEPKRINLNGECLRNVSPEKINETEILSLEENETKENRYAEVNNEMETIEESSSGIFSNEVPNGQHGMLSSPERNSIIQPFHENKYRNTRRNPNNSFDSDEFLRTKSDTNDSVHDEVTKTSTKDNDDSEYSCSGSNVESLRCSLFQWANTKVTAKPSIKSATAKQKSVVKDKPKNVRNIPPRKKSIPVGNQQSLLNTFGFQKKTVLKH